MRVLILILCFFTACNSKKKEKNVVVIHEKVQDIRFVAAKSGLNYRDKPKGKILGKFLFGEKLEVFEFTGNHEVIKDHKEIINGEWIGVKIDGKSVYVFSGYLLDEDGFKEIQYSNLVPDNYEIEYQAVGNLNKDDIEDLTLVIKKKNNFEGDRSVLVFIGDGKLYNLFKESKTVFPNKFYSNGDNDYNELYVQEDILIKDHKLHVNLSGTGPVGNLNFSYVYDNKNLILSEIETYNIGAGAWHTIKYNLLQGEVIEEIVNTLTSDMETETNTYKSLKKRFKFEDSNIDDVIRETNKHRFN